LGSHVTTSLRANPDAQYRAEACWVEWPEGTGEENQRTVIRRPKRRIMRSRAIASVPVPFPADRLWC